LLNLFDLQVTRPDMTRRK